MQTNLKSVSRKDAKTAKNAKNASFSVEPAFAVSSVFPLRPLRSWRLCANAFAVNESAL